MVFFTKLEQKNIYNVYGDTQKNQIAKKILIKKNTAGGIILPDVRL